MPKGRGRTLGEIIYWDILQQIQAGRFAPDQRLQSEKELCEQFKVSRPIVRQALERLRSDGLVYSRQGAGTFVRGPIASTSPLGAGESPRLVQSIADVRNVYDFRIAVEGEVAYAAALNPSRQAVAEIERLQDRMTETLSRGEPALDEDIAFHMAVAKATGNQFFVEAMRMMVPHLRFVMELVMKLSMVDPKEHVVAVREQHEAVLDSIRRRDPDGARRAMRTMITNARNRVFVGFDDQERAPTEADAASPLDAPRSQPQHEPKRRRRLTRA